MVDIIMPDNNCNNTAASAGSSEAGKCCTRMTTALHRMSARGDSSPADSFLAAGRNPGFTSFGKVVMADHNSF